MSVPFSSSCDSRHVKVFKAYCDALNPSSKLKHFVNEDKIFICAEQLLNLIFGKPDMDEYGINTAGLLFSKAETYQSIFFGCMISARFMDGKIRILHFVDFEKVCLLLSCAGIPQGVSMLFSGVWTFVMNRQICPKVLKGDDATIELLLGECKEYMKQRIAMGTSPGVDLFNQFVKMRVAFNKTKERLDEMELNLAGKEMSLAGKEVRLAEKETNLGQLEKDLVRWRASVDADNVQRSEYLDAREADINARVLEADKRKAECDELTQEANQDVKRIKVAMLEADIPTE